MMTTKVCGRCKADRPVGEFSRFARAADGLQRWCKSCHGEHKKARYRADPEKFRRASRDHYRSLEDKATVNRRNNLRKYGLTPESFDAMLERQGGKCAICSAPEPGGRHGQWHVDHDHQCCPGQRSCGDCVRSLLCGACNNGIGMFDDDPDRLMAAATYLLQFKDVLHVGVPA
jgi:hypothetical protein